MTTETARVKNKSAPRQMSARVQDIRRELRLTLEQVAERSGLSVSTISKIENAKRGWSPASLQALADALGVGMADLINPYDVLQEIDTKLAASHELQTSHTARLNELEAKIDKLTTQVGEILLRLPPKA